MSVPLRSPALAEATQEVNAIDVLEVIETHLPSTNQPLPPPRAPSASASSIAPVGLDLMPSRAMDEEINPTMEIRLPRPRRNLGGIVVAAVSACTLLLVAAGLARVGHASDEASPSSAASRAPFVNAAVTTASPEPTVSPTVPAAQAITNQAPDLPSTGTVLIGRSSAGHVQLDGRNLAASSAIVSCGTHQIRIGHGKPHSIDVPCGGEITVTR